MIPIKQFKLLSRAFRRVSGDLLNAEDRHEAMRLAKRFISHIENEPIIYDFIQKNHTQDYNIEEIRASKNYNHKYDIPIEIDEEISFIYQLLKYGTEHFTSYEDLTTYGYAFYKGSKYSDTIREFNREVVKLLVNHITDYLEGMAIELGIDEKPNAKILVQGNLGQLNYAETGNIDAHQTINQGENNDIQKVAQELIQLLKESSIENPDVKEDALDFVEEIAQNVEQGETVKPSLFRRAKAALTDINSMVDDGSQVATKIGQFISLMSGFIS
ncbi:hypothetical protein OCB08_22725 [Bacillus cereus]|uniref:hypothetical protein n=1 Tax=Bacillus cereus group TaxID=86661 RepID=UPI000A3035D4|nr:MULTISPECIES: hypothetical protein [Bacillus cereus group]MCC2358149.1 hypothetical protein [Bacillus paranthracis]MCC2369248.1 hypothetical protein [Bacillus cereus]MCC2451967.1 hypothetical protein [Bacillus cereus]MCC2491501.1 hypothetical protein [Bacillus cereus]MCU5451305.1 hypothetical protein [Bacillus cereus]